MIDLPLKKLRPGMRMAQTVFNSSGANFLTKGTKLTEEYIEKLGQIGIRDMYVLSTDTESPLVAPEDILQEKTRSLAVRRVYDVFQQVVQDGVFDVEPLEKAAMSMLDDIVCRQMKLVQLTDIRVHDMYTFAHSVNVAMLNALMGVLCGYSKEKLSDLTMGGLLHDLGKTTVPFDILNKAGRLTNEEFDVIRTHPEAGSEQLIKMDIPRAKNYAIVARQHHEHIDGRGYPDGLAGTQIHPYGKISAIADVYDALTSSRSYKKAYAPSVAYNIMVNCSGGQFDDNLLDLFFKNVAIYPVGTVVKTNMGYAIVRDVRFGATLRPTISIFANKNAIKLPKVYTIDMRETKQAQIETVMNDSELYHLISHIRFDPASLLEEDQM